MSHENTPKTPARVRRKLTYLSTFYHKLAHTAQKHVFSLTVFLVPTKAQEQLRWLVVWTQRVSKRHSLNGEIKGSQVKRQKEVSPEEVKVLECFPRIRGLKLAGVEHEQTHEVQPSHAGRVTRLMADCTWEQKGSHSQSSSDPRNPEPMEIECTG